MGRNVEFFYPDFRDLFKIIKDLAFQKLEDLPLGEGLF